MTNSWILAILIIVISFAVGFIITFMFGSVNTAVSAVCGFIAAMGVGQIYSHVFRQVMPKKLRFKTALNFFIIQAVMGGLLVIAFMNMAWWLLAIIILLVLLYSLAVYWALGFGGRIQIKALEKKK